MLSKKSSLNGRDIKNAIKHEENVVKDHLKTMAKNSSGHSMRTLGRIFKYGLVSFGRNIWLSVASTLVMTITIVIFIITIFASAVLSSTAENIKEKIDITIYFKPGTSSEVLSKLSEIMSEDNNVKNVEISSTDDEYASTLAENLNDENISSILQDKDMKESLLSNMPATMRVFVNDPNNLNSIKSTVDNNRLFQENLSPDKQPTYETNQGQIATISSWANIAKTGGVILGVVFLGISMLVIFNTIRMAIFSRREEIYMMKLVGADSSFIRGPFLVEAEMCGIISGALASTLGLVGFNLIAPKLTSYGIDISPISAITDSSLVIIAFLAMIMLGVIVGAISARLALHKYLR